MTKASAVETGIPMPALTPEAEAAALLSDVYGIDATATRVSSELDETFIARARDGRRFVLKIASPAERRDVLDFQTGVLQHLGVAAPDILVPRLIATLEGETIHVARRNSGYRFVRLLSYLEGTQLSAMAATRPMLMTELGRLLGRLDLVLAEFRPAVPSIELAWDITHADRLMPMAQRMADAGERRLALAAFDEFLSIVQPRRPELPRQIIHNDMNPHNILVGPDDPPRLVGIIDFGDIVEAARINDAAVALAYVIGRPGGDAFVAAFMAGFRAVLPLEAVELSVLPSLVRARLAMTVALTEARAAAHPERAAYILRNRPASLAGLRRMAAMTPPEINAAFRANGAAAWPNAT